MGALKTTQGNPGPVTYSECFKCGGTRFSNGRLKNGVRDFRCSRCGQHRYDNGNDPGRRSAPSERARAVQMYRMGMSSTAISKETGRTAQSILTWVRDAGGAIWVGKRPRHAYRSYRRGCTGCGGEVVADNEYFICLDCGKSNRQAV